MIEYAEKVQWPQVRAGYEEGLAARHVSPRTGVVIKNFCENLRSALDWLAEEIRDSCGIQGPTKIYFPIAKTRSDFDRQIKAYFPGLKTKSPEVWSYLWMIQPFRRRGERWLIPFNRVNNENKHFDLVVHRTREAPVGSAEAKRLGGITLLEGTQQSGNWVEFRFSGVRKGAQMLLHSSLVGVRHHTEEILSLLS